MASLCSLHNRRRPSPIIPPRVTFMTDWRDSWPPLPLNVWRPSYETVHLWAQIVGKVRIALTPLLNHWWNSALYVTARGLTTDVMPYNGQGIEIRFDFV